MPPVPWAVPFAAPGRRGGVTYLVGGRADQVELSGPGGGICPTLRRTVRRVRSSSSVQHRIKKSAYTTTSLCGQDTPNGRCSAGPASSYCGSESYSQVDLLRRAIDPDFLAWYERWLDHMAAGLDNRALELTSPRLHAHPNRYRLASKI